MKTLIFIFLFAVAVFPNGFESFDSTGQQVSQEKKQLQNQEQNREENMQQFVDKKGTGEKAGIRERKRKDVFIDKDGDGICDTRQGGMSFHKLRKREGQRHSGSGGHGGGMGNGGNNGGGMGDGMGGGN